MNECMHVAFRSFSFSNDHFSDNLVKHALTRLIMTVMLMMSYRSLSSEFLQTSSCLYNLLNVC